MNQKHKKSTIIAIVVMAVSFVLAAVCVVYALILSNIVNLKERYERERTLAENVLDKKLADVISGGDPAKEGKYLLASYDSTNETVKDIAFSYDNALCALAFMAMGDRESASAILDAFTYAAINDRGGVPRIRNAYVAGNIVGESYGNVRLPGHYDNEAGMWVEDASNVGSSSGNIAWAALAMLWYNELYGAEEDTTLYVDTASGLLDWIINNCSDDNPGFIAGINGWTEGGGKGEVLTYKSVEHNVDCMVAFKAMYDLTGEAGYLEAYNSSKTFIKEMYNAKGGYYYTGTTNDGVTPNADKIVLDAQVWTALAASDDFKVKDRKILKTLKKIKTADSGYSFCNSEAGGGFWSEGTAFTAMYYLKEGKKKDLYASLDALRGIQRVDGRFPACSGESINTGMDLSNGTSWVYRNDPHIAPLAWFLMTVEGFNPFELKVDEQTTRVYTERRNASQSADIEAMRQKISDERMVIHAGGRYYGANGEEFTYTNSIEALQNTYAKGNRICEIDFLLSSDGQLVCAHNSDQAWALGLPFDSAPDYDTFMQAKINGQLHTMDLKCLVAYMRSHSDLYIVTDIKAEGLYNADGCAMIKEYAPDLMNRFIIQIYHRDEYEKVKGMGFPYIIYTLYNSDEEERKEENILKACEELDLVALVMPEVWIEDGSLTEKINEIGVPVFVHTVNDQGRMVELSGYGVTGFYTDDVNAKNSK